jgi:hypothetical protein
LCIGSSSRRWRAFALHLVNSPRPHRAGIKAIVLYEVNVGGSMCKYSIAIIPIYFTISNKSKCNYGNNYANKNERFLVG